MRFYSWRLTGIVGQRWENHVFPSEFGHPRHFIALCEPPLRGRGGHSGESKKEYYCPKCKELAPIAEAEAQAAEDARIAQLELKRPATIAQINAILGASSMDDVLRFLRHLQRDK